MFIGETPLDAIEQCCGFERLAEKALSAGRGRFIAQTLIRKGRDQDDGYRATLFAAPSYEIESAHSGHMNVGDGTLEEEQTGGRQESFR
jgi:hypothetical protein